MQRKNDTDTNWLVYADWLEESGREAQAHAVRDAVERTPEAGWCYEWLVGGSVGGIGVGGSVGGSGVGVGVGVGGGAGSDRIGGVGGEGVGGSSVGGSSVGGSSVGGGGITI